MFVKSRSFQISRQNLVTFARRRETYTERRNYQFSYILSKHLLFILILAVCTNVFAQQTKSISGVVYDSNTGEALIGVSVLEVGTTNGTITDFDGKYTLKVSSNKVSFSYVGFKTVLKERVTLPVLWLL